MKSYFNMEEMNIFKHNDRTVILVPPLHLLGGISMHYKGLKEYWQSDIRYYEVFKEDNPTMLSIFKAVWNYIRFIAILVVLKPKIVVANISLKKGFYSKNKYIRIAKLFNKKVVTFIHGWDTESEYMLTTGRGKFTLNNTDTFIVLSGQFKKKLEIIGIQKNIYISTTKVDNRLLKGFDIGKRVGDIKKFLFLSRVERAKGIFLALDVFKLLQKDNPILSFTIAGQGTALEEVKNYVNDNNIKNVYFAGRVDGESLSKTFADSDCFFLLSLSEGMPAALLEAMAFGLPVITCPVGGIPDFFVDGDMGIMSSSTVPQYYYIRIKELMDNPLKTQNISRTNYVYAEEHFYASSVVRNLEKIFNESEKN